MSLTGVTSLDQLCEELLLKLWSPNFSLVDYLDEFSGRKSAVEKIDFVYQDLKKHNLLKKFLVDDKSAAFSKENRLHGNKLYDERDYDGAYKHFARAILYANDEETLSMAYVSRSWVLYQSGLYQDCVKDIDRALSLKYPNQLRKKAISKRKKAASKIKPLPEFHEPVPQITAEFINPKIPGATNLIEIVENDPNFGRHIIAAKDLQVGDLLLVEKPFITAGKPLRLDDSTFDHCSECGELCFTLIPCGNCTKVAYCGDECKKKAFEEYHKYECAITNTMVHYPDGFLPIDFIKDCQIALRIALKLGMKNYQDTNEFREVLTLKSSLAHTSPDKQLNASIIVATIFDLVNNHTDFFKDFPGNEQQFKEVLFNGIFISHLNSLEICETVQNPEQLADEDLLRVLVAKGLFPKTSLFAHSCLPNVVPIPHGNILVSKVVYPIKKGETCFIDRGANFDRRIASTRSRRQEELLKQFNIVCKCQKCAPARWNIVPSLFTLTRGSQDSTSGMVTPRYAGKDMESLKNFIGSCARVLGNFEPNHPQYLTFCRCIYFALLLLGNNRMLAPKIASF